MTRLKAAVVGLGYWGPNLARNFQAGEDYELVALVDANPGRLAKVADAFPGAGRFTSLTDALRETQPDLVAVATPVASHHGLAMQALESGAHVLCEKPIAASVAEASALVEAAQRWKRHLFVDHTFTYTGAVRAIRDHHVNKKLGELFYVDSVRINLGLFQPDVDVVWDLAPHDLAILDYIVGEKVRTLQATGTSHNPRKLADVAYLSLEFDSGLTANLHLSWLSPVKVRRMIFSGRASSIIYDDLEASEKIKIYDAGVSFDVSDLEARKQVMVNYRRGDMRAPALDNKEALALEVKEIARVIRGESLRVATGEDGLAIVRILEAAGRSMAAEGARVRV
jgi:predicted dehydrogenase